MYLNRGHNAPKRVTAVLLVAFCVLSSGRSLVPGMCATLAAMRGNNEAAPSCCSPARGCVPAREGQSAPATVVSSFKPRAECAFCNLAKGIVPIESAVRISSPVTTISLAVLAPRERFAEFERWNFARPRDPPRSPSGLSFFS